MRLLLLLCLFASLHASETSTPLVYTAGQSGVWLNNGTQASSSSTEANFAVTVTPGRPVAICLQTTQATYIGSVSGQLTTLIPANSSYNYLATVTGAIYFTSATNGTITATPLLVLSASP